MMGKPISTLLLLIVALAALIAAGPTLTQLAGALIPLVLVVAVLRVVWAATRRW
jgi:hypothetical protein